MMSFNDIPCFTIIVLKRLSSRVKRHFVSLITISMALYKPHFTLQNTDQVNINTRKQKRLSES